MKMANRSASVDEDNNMFDEVKVCGSILDKNVEANSIIDAIEKKLMLKQELT